ncbi:MAG: LamG domain-containing protein, partial [Candidatus Aenigmarchaeota archaeon]|nr:LamG domain-containing protein [Candidatus Aenigmarchaeota archaeon]
TEEMKLYVNGVKKATADYSVTISTNSNNLLIGNLFNGTIDEVVIYNRALSAEEILDLYNR